MDLGRHGRMVSTNIVPLTVDLFIQATRIGIALHPPARVEEARLKVVADGVNLLPGHQLQVQTPPLWVRNGVLLRQPGTTTSRLASVPTPQRRQVPAEHPHTRVAGEHRGPMGGVTLAQVVLAGEPWPITTRKHQTSGMSLLLGAKSHHRHNWIRSQWDGDPLAVGCGIRGPTWDLAGEKTRFRTILAKHLQQQPLRMPQVLQVLIRRWVESGRMETST